MPDYKDPETYANDISHETAVRARQGVSWTPSLGCWQAYHNNSSIFYAREFAGIKGGE
jgi:hypothetical protein